MEKRKEGWKQNVSFVLVEPGEAGNIGAAARAMKNMGFANLRLVRPGAAIDEEARRMARHSLDVLEGAALFGDLDEALRDCALVVGTTRRKGGRRGVFLPVGEAARKVRAFAEENRVAVLFGGERRGLLNEEAERCGLLFEIPADRAQPSLNVAQAVLLAAYEISGPHLGEEGEAPSGRLLTRGELERLGRRMGEVLEKLGYGSKGDWDLRRSIELNLGRVLQRAGLSPGEAETIYGLCSRVERKLKAGSGK
jgi:TrmH family RNA methyltransferase